jgi:hypothetical protein
MQVQLRPFPMRASLQGVDVAGWGLGDLVVEGEDFLCRPYLHGDIVGILGNH